MLLNIFAKIIEYPIKVALFVLGFLWIFNPFRASLGLTEGDREDLLGKPYTSRELQERLEDAKGVWLTSLFWYATIPSLITWAKYDWSTSAFWNILMIVGGFFAAWITVGMLVVFSNAKWTEDVDVIKRMARSAKLAEKERQLDENRKFWEDIRSKSKTE